MKGIGEMELLILGMVLIVGANIHSYYLFVKDKQLARQAAYRLSEKRLIFASLLLGGIGSLLAMRIARHKTQHLLFQTVVPLSALGTICAFVWLLVNLLNHLMSAGILSLK